VLRVHKEGGKKKRKQFQKNAPLNPAVGTSSSSQILLSAKWGKKKKGERGEGGKLASFVSIPRDANFCGWRRGGGGGGTAPVEIVRRGGRSAVLKCTYVLEYQKERRELIPFKGALRLAFLWGVKGVEKEKRIWVPTFLASCERKWEDGTQATRSLASLSASAHVEEGRKKRNFGWGVGGRRGVTRFGGRGMAPHSIFPFF